MGEIGAQGTAGGPANAGGVLDPAGGTSDSTQPAPLVARIAQLTGEVRIVPDPRTNSLLIRATREDFQLIEATVEQLDVRPLQVLIDVVIAEVRRERSLALGLGAKVSSPNQGTGDGEWSASTPDPGLGDIVVRMLQLGKVDLAATLRAAASRGEVSILSRPVLLAANNSPAEIVVGSQRPFVQVQRSLPTDTPVRDQVVQFKDVGTRLSVTPTVSKDGYVMLEVAQEVSAATAEVAFDAPVISTRSIRTQLLVKDGHTAVMGGLVDRQREVTRSGVPILSSIPLLGALFGTHSTRTTETELFVFLTPRVIRTDQDLDQASDSVGTRTKSLTGR
jgi:general secretion pathway protein D